MPWNGSGTFYRSYSWVSDLNANIPITASRMDADTDDIVDNGLNNCITRDGQGVATANQPMGGFIHTGVGDATALTNYPSVLQIANGSLIYGTVGGTASAITLTLPVPITSYVGGQSFRMKLGSSITGATTLQVSGIASPKAVQYLGSALSANAYLANDMLDVDFDGTAFQVVQSPRTSLSGALLTANNLSELTGTAATARTNLGLGTAAVQNVGAFAQVANNLSDVTAATARTNLAVPGTGVANTFAALNTFQLGIDITTPMASPSQTEAGYMGSPVTTKDSTYGFLLADRGFEFLHTSGSGHTWTIPANGTIALPVGAKIAGTNTGAGVVTIAITSDTLIWCPPGTTGSRSIAQYGKFVLDKIASTTWTITGVGIT